MPDGGTDPGLGRGAGRLLVAVYAVFALSASSRAALQLATQFEQAPVAYLLSAVAAAVYLVATVALARGHRRLALVTTHRDESGVSDAFQHWLGNVRRLPGTEELVLSRLDEDATGDQIAVEPLQVVVSNPGKEREKGQKPSHDSARSRDDAAEPLSD